MRQSTNCRTARGQISAFVCFGLIFATQARDVFYERPKLESLNVTRQRARSLQITPLLLATLIALYAVAFGYNHDFAAFILLLVLAMAIPLLLIVAGWMLFVAFVNKAWRWDHYVAVMTILAAPLLGYWTLHLRDQARFVVWAPFHLSHIGQKSGQNGIVAFWDSWGMVATTYNNSYLVRDVNDGISSLEEANAYAQRLGLSCEIMKSERVWRQLYVITTTDCELR